MIRELMNKYKDVTEKAIMAVKGESENSFMDEREEILKEIFSGTFSKEEIKLIYDELNIADLDSRLKKSIEEEMFEVKKELKDIKVRKNASRGYYGAVNKVNIISTKI